MSYPPQRYFGEEGEISATFKPREHEADVVRASGSRTLYIATSASTKGEFGLYRVEMGPRAPGPTTHFHKTISESFFVLAGSVNLFDGTRWVKAQKGDFLYVPTGGLHAFKNDSDEPSSMLLLFSPGAPREEYFEKVGEMAKRGGKEFQEFLERHDSYFVDRSDPARK